MDKEYFESKNYEFCKQAKIPFTVKRNGVEHVFCLGEIMSPSDLKNMRKGKIYSCASEIITPNKILQCSTEETTLLQSQSNDSNFSEDYNIKRYEKRDSFHSNSSLNNRMCSQKREEEEELCYQEESARSFGLEIQPPCPQCKNDLIFLDTDHKTPPFCSVCQTYFVRSADRALLNSWVDSISSANEEILAKGKIVFTQDFEERESESKVSCINQSLFDDLMHATLDHFASKPIPILDDQESSSFHIDPINVEEMSSLESSSSVMATGHSSYPILKGKRVMFDDLDTRVINAVNTIDEEKKILQDACHTGAIASDTMLKKAPVKYSLSLKTCNSCDVPMMKMDGELTCITCIAINQQAKLKANKNRKMLKKDVHSDKSFKESLSQQTDEENKSFEIYTQQMNAYLAMSHSFSSAHDRASYEVDNRDSNDNFTCPSSRPYDVKQYIHSSFFNIDNSISNLSHDEHSFGEISNTILKKRTLKNKRCTRPKPEDPSLLSNDFVISEKSIDSTHFNENKENTLNSATSVKPNAVCGSTDSNKSFNQLLQRLEYISKQIDGIDREIEAIERRQI